MTSADLLTDAFGRIRETVHEAVEGLTASQLAARLDDDANSIAWLCWHLTRVQDDHVAGAFGVPQVWIEAGKRFELPFAPSDIGYGHSSRQVSQVTVSSGDVLSWYQDLVHEQTVQLVAGGLAFLGVLTGLTGLRGRGLRGRGQPAPAVMPGQLMGPGRLRAAAGAGDHRREDRGRGRAAQSRQIAEVGWAKPVAHPPGQEGSAERVTGSDRIDDRGRRDLGADLLPRGEGSHGRRAVGDHHAGRTPGEEFGRRGRGVLPGKQVSEIFRTRLDHADPARDPAQPVQVSLP